MQARGAVRGGLRLALWHARVDHDEALAEVMDGRRTEAPLPEVKILLHARKHSFSAAIACDGGMRSVML